MTSWAWLTVSMLSAKACVSVAVSVSVSVAVSAGVLALVGCGSGASTTTGDGGALTDGGFGDASSSSFTCGISPSTPTDGGWPLCNDLEQLGTPVPIVVMTERLPSAVGGQLTPGIYVLTQVTEYVGPAGDAGASASPPVDPTTLRLCGGHMDELVSSSGSESRYNDTIRSTTKFPPQFAVQTDCGYVKHDTSTTDIGGTISTRVYSATPTELRTFAAGSETDTGTVFVYTRR
jgi:hypothetical protein